MNSSTSKNSLNEEWFYKKDGKVFGPVNMQDALHHIDSGFLSDNDEVGGSENGPWEKVHEIRYQRYHASLIAGLNEESFYKKDGKVFGPVIMQDALHHIDSGFLSENDEVSASENGPWLKIDKLDYSLYKAALKIYKASYNKEWFYKKDGKVFRPINMQDALHHIDTGFLSENDVVSASENGPWIKLGEIKNLIYENFETAKKHPKEVVSRLLLLLKFRG